MKNKFPFERSLHTKTYLKPCQTAMAERLCENRLELLVINYFKKELRRRCFTGFKGGYVLETNFSFIVCLFVCLNY